MSIASNRSVGRCHNDLQFCQQVGIFNSKRRPSNSGNFQVQ